MAMMDRDDMTADEVCNLNFVYHACTIHVPYMYLLTRNKTSSMMRSVEVLMYFDEIIIALFCPISYRSCCEQ